MSDEITAEDIVAQGQSPQRVTGDEGTVEERPIDDAIKS